MIFFKCGIELFGITETSDGHCLKAEVFLLVLAKVAMPKGNNFMNCFWRNHIEITNFFKRKYFINLIKFCHGTALDNLISIIGVVAACSSAAVREGRGNWEFVDVDGSDGQVVALWPESVFIGGPGQSEFLAFGRDPVRGSSVGVAINVVVSGFAIRIVGDALHLLLHLRFLTGRVVGSRVAAKLTKLTFISIFLIN